MSLMPRPPADPQPIVGILSPGEMGTALARELRDRQVRILSTTASRSARTDRRARAAELELVAGLDDLGRSCDVLLSVVHPSAALDLAREVRAHWTPAWRLRTFVDANSISPGTMRQIVDVFADTPMQVVDAAIHGSAGLLRTHATMYLGGEQAERVAELFRPCLRTRMLGDQPGQASLMKMTLGGMTKGLVAMFLQAGCLAEHYEFAETFADELRHFYPEMTDFLSRSVPTYRQHAGRRSEEMGELAATLFDAGMDHRLVLEMQALFRGLAECELATMAPEPASDGWQSLIRRLSRQDFHSIRQPSDV